MTITATTATTPTATTTATAATTALRPIGEMIPAILADELCIFGIAIYNLYDSQ